MHIDCKLPVYDSLLPCCLLTPPYPYPEPWTAIQCPSLFSRRRQGTLSLTRRPWRRCFSTPGLPTNMCVSWQWPGHSGRASPSSLISSSDTWVHRWVWGMSKSSVVKLYISELYHRKFRYCMYYYCICVCTYVCHFIHSFFFFLITHIRGGKASAKQSRDINKNIVKIKIGRHSWC